MRTDIWSFGCIVSEILQAVLREEQGDKSESTILFEGSYCFPVSPKQNENKEFVVSSREQLIKIMEVLDPEGETLGRSYFDRPDMHDFYKFCATQVKGGKKSNLKSLHKGISTEWYQLLDGCLQMDPSTRFNF